MSARCHFAAALRERALDALRRDLARSVATARRRSHARERTHTARPGALWGERRKALDECDHDLARTIERAAGAPKICAPLGRHSHRARGGTGYPPSPRSTVAQAGCAGVPFRSPSSPLGRLAVVLSTGLRARPNGAGVASADTGEAASIPAPTGNANVNGSGLARTRSLGTAGQRGDNHPHWRGRPAGFGPRWRVSGDRLGTVRRHAASVPFLSSWDMSRISGSQGLVRSVLDGVALRRAAPDDVRHFVAERRERPRAPHVLACPISLTNRDAIEWRSLDTAPARGELP